MERSRRLVIPDQPPVSNDRPRRLDIPAETAAPSGSDRPRRLAVPESAPAKVVEPTPSRNRTIAPPVAAAPAAPAPETSSRRTINPAPTAPAPPQRQERPKTRADALVEKASQLEPTLQPHRIRGRIDTILQNPTMMTVLEWGNRNLAPLQQTSNQKARISSELARIDAVGWLARTRDASCKPPSLLDRFTAKPPSYYDGMLQKTRSELLQFVQELEAMKNAFFREITDLHLDAMSLMVCCDDLPDDLKISASNRTKTLLASHQTAAVLQHTIEQSLMLCADFITQIDSMLSVTLPQWKAAFQNP